MAIESSDLADLKRAIIEALKDGITASPDTGAGSPGIRTGDAPERVDPAKARERHASLMRDLDAEEAMIKKIFQSRSEQDQLAAIAHERAEADLKLKYQEAEIEKEQYENAKRDLEIKRKKNQEQVQANRLLFDQSKALGSMLQMGKHPIFNVDNFIKLGKAMKTAFTSAKGFFSMLGGGLLGLLFAFIDAIINLIFAVDKMESSIKKTTGATQAYAREVTNAWEANRKFVPEMKDFEASFVAAYGTITDFTKQGMAPYRQEMMGTMAILTKFGVSQKDSAQAMQNSMKIFGETGKEAAHSAREMTAFARDLQVPASDLMSQFNSMAPQLAKLGQAGEKAFKDLARTAKATGMEMSKLLQITDKFDTFEGAAEQAGKLNAALGQNAVNAMDLMMETDPTARFEMIRDAIMDTGLSFDDMSYYQRKFYTEALGLGDVADLAKMMSGDMSDLDGGIMKTSAEYAKMAEEARKNQDLQERFKAALMDLVPVMTPVVDKMREMMEAFENEEGAVYEFIHVDLPKFVEDLVNIKDELKAGGKILLWVLGLYAGFKLLMFILTPFMWSYAAALKLKNLAEGTSLKMQKKLAPAVAGTATSLLAVGGAIALIGIGVGAAAYGLAEFVKAFDGLEGEELGGVAMGLTMLGVGFAILVGILLKTAPAAGVAAGPLWAIGGAVALIGLGIGMTSAGMAKLMEQMTPDKVANLGLISLELTGLSLAIAALAGSLVALTFGGLGLLVLGGVFDEIDDSVKEVGPLLEPYTAILTSLAGVDGSGLERVANSLTKIKNNIAKLGPHLGTMKELKETLNAMEAVQLSAKALGLSAGPVQPESRGIAQRFNPIAGKMKDSSSSQGGKVVVPMEFIIDGTKFGEKVIEIIGNEVKASALR